MILVVLNLCHNTKAQILLSIDQPCCLNSTYIGHPGYLFNLLNIYQLIHFLHSQDNQLPCHVPPVTAHAADSANWRTLCALQIFLLCLCATVMIVQLSSNKSYLFMLLGVVRLSLRQRAII